MTFTRQGNIVTIGDPEAVGSFRIEPGPVKKVEVATPALLADDKTATHYFEGERDIGMTDGAGEPIMHKGIDADARPIKVGNPMAYLDWLGFQRGEDGAGCFYLYQLTKWTAAEREKREAPKDAPPYWREIGTFPTEDEAISAALSGK